MNATNDETRSQWASAVDVLRLTTSVDGGQTDQRPQQRQTAHQARCDAVEHRTYHRAPKWRQSVHHIFIQFCVLWFSQLNVWICIDFSFLLCCN